MSYCSNIAGQPQVWKEPDILATIALTLSVWFSQRLCCVGVPSNPCNNKKIVYMQQHRKAAAAAGVEGAWYRGSYPPFLIPQPLRLTLHYVSRTLYYPTNHTFLSIHTGHVVPPSKCERCYFLSNYCMCGTRVGIIPIILSGGKIWAGAVQQHLRITKHFKRLSILPTDCFERRLHHWTKIQEATDDMHKGCSV